MGAEDAIGTGKKMPIVSLEVTDGRHVPCALQYLSPTVSVRRADLVKEKQCEPRPQTYMGEGGHTHYWDRHGRDTAWMLDRLLEDVSGVATTDDLPQNVG
jgi:hypothetical protein